MPRDFDISPYFQVVKPTIEYGFDYTALHWADKPRLPPAEVAGSLRSVSAVPRQRRRRSFLRKLTKKRRFLKGMKT